MRRVLHFLVSAVLLLAGSLVAVAYREGPLPSLTGAFGEQTCRACHFDNPANDPRGSLQIEGVPKIYAPGREYPIRVVLRREAITRGGFEMAVRFADGPTAGQQAGRLRTTDARAQIVYAPDRKVQYIQHTAIGSSVAPGDAQWTVTWTAPETALGPVRFDVAANASNDDASPLGDFIYTIAMTSRSRPYLPSQPPSTWTDWPVR